MAAAIEFKTVGAAGWASEIFGGATGAEGWGSEILGGATGAGWGSEIFGGATGAAGWGSEIFGGATGAEGWGSEIFGGATGAEGWGSEIFAGAITSDKGVDAVELVTASEFAARAERLGGGGGFKTSSLFSSALSGETLLLLQGSGFEGDTVDEDDGAGVTSAIEGATPAAETWLGGLESIGLTVWGLDGASELGPAKESAIGATFTVDVREVECVTQC